jgi:integrase
VATRIARWRDPKHLDNAQGKMKLSHLVRIGEERIWKKKAHRDQCVTNVTDMVNFLGDPEIDKITTETVDLLTQIMLPNYRPATVNRKMAALHTLLKYAHDRDWISKIPKFQWQYEDNERIRWLSPEEEQQLLILLPEKVSAFCEILIHTGMRRSELLTLQRDQIDGDYARLWNTKSNRPRSVPLSPRAKELIERYVPFDLHPFYIYREWNNAKKAMGLENDKNFVLHMLRHTAATRLLDTTGNIVFVQKLLGHSKLDTTMRYAHTSDDQLRNAVGLVTSKYERKAHYAESSSG